MAPERWPILWEISRSDADRRILPLPAAFGGFDPEGRWIPDPALPLERNLTMFYL